MSKIKSVRVRVISEQDGHELGMEWDEDCLDAARLLKERGIVVYVNPAMPSAVSESDPQAPVVTPHQSKTVPDKMIHRDDAKVTTK